MNGPCTCVRPFCYLCTLTRPRSFRSILPLSSEQRVGRKELTRNAVDTLWILIPLYQRERYNAQQPRILSAVHAMTRDTNRPLVLEYDDQEV